jgi:hypothetical protein
MIMKKGILIAVILLMTAGMAQAQEGELHGKVDLTWTSKYIWRGFDVYGDKAAIHPTIDLDLFGTGFHFSTEAHRANSSGHENTERWDYTLYYLGRIFEDEPYATNYRVGYVYYNYPDMSSHTTDSIDLQELHAIFSWPKILGIEGLVPTYCLVKLSPANSGTIVGANSPFGGTASGFAHIFMLDYGLPVASPITGDTMTLNLHSEFVYNDGVSPLGTNVDHDWSNAVFGVTTNFDLGNNLTLTPGVYWQSSWDDSVNNEDEYWVSLGVGYKF